MGFLAAQNKFNATGTPLDQSNYNQLLGGLLNNGVPGQVQNQQGQLANMLMQQAQGQGPGNVAQNQLNQQAAQNQQQGAALLASQKGINPALAARQILENNANTQNATNQAAGTLQAQQVQGALGNLGNTLAQQQAGNTAQLGTLGQLQQGQNALNVQQNLGVQGLNQQTAAQNIAGQNALTGGILSGLSGIGGSLVGRLAKAAPAAAPVTGYDMGGMVPGQPNVQGDSKANDTVDAKLSPGEIVVPRSAAKDAKKAKAFIDAVKNKNKEVDGNSSESFGHVISAQNALHSRLKELERFCYGGMA